MPILTSAAQIAAKPFPKAISPKAHAIIDYMTVGAFFMSAAWFWKRTNALQLLPSSLAEQSWRLACSQTIPAG